MVKSKYWYITVSLQNREYYNSWFCKLVHDSIHGSTTMDYRMLMWQKYSECIVALNDPVTVYPNTNHYTVDHI